MVSEPGGDGTDPPSTRSVADATREVAPPTALLEPPELTPGAAVGRYVVAHRIGEGGMGVVMLAHDPDLDRNVALKLVREGAGGSELDARAQSRLYREAQAMAQLSHPNVVPVYDVEHTDLGVCIAMEYVRGTTLRAWLGAEPRSWQAVVAAFRAAGRGLRAAHAEGIVHRDFKPTNVLVANDGRVMVMDFGLARAPLGASTSEPEGPVGGRGTGGGSGSTQLTGAGSVLGTPSYMAPEQHRGEPADARADQYGFCVALFEGLCGERPFSGKDHRAVLRAKMGGPPRLGAKGVPGYLRRVIARGLAPSPDRRFPSMDALLTALRPRRSRVLPAVGVVALGGLGAAAFAVGWWDLIQIAKPGDVCDGADERLSGVWDAQRRAAARDALLASGVGHAEQTWSVVSVQLDAYADSWVDGHRRACEASHVVGTQSPQELDLRMACLQQRRWALDGLVDALGSEGAVDRAIRATMRLPSIDRCSDLTRLRAAVPLPEDPEVARAVSGIREQLATAESLFETGQYDAAAEHVTPLVSQATTLGYDPIIADVAITHGAIVEALGRYEDAVAAFTAAYDAAIRSGYDESAAKAAVKLLFVTGPRIKDIDRAKRWRAEASARVARLTDPGRIALDLEQYTAVSYQDEGDYAQATAHARRALELADTMSGLDPLVTAPLHETLGNALQRSGELEPASEQLRKALEIRTAGLGASHPHVASSYNNLGIVQYRQGGFDDAEASFRQAVEIWETSVSGDHPQVANALINLGAVHQRAGRHDDALAVYKRAAQLREETGGASDPILVKALTNTGNVHQAKGDLDAASAVQNRALTIATQAFGAEHPQVAAILNNLGSLYQQMGRLDDALDHYARAATMWEATLGPDHPMLAHAAKGRGEVLVALGDATGVAHIERALEIREAANADAAILEDTRYALAQALWDTGRDRPRAIALAEQARTAMARRDDPKEVALRDAIDQWLRGRHS